MNSDSISIIWHIDDIIESAESNEIDITKDEAREVLKSLKKNHDCCYGITWETIDAELELLIARRPK